MAYGAKYRLIFDTVYSKSKYDASSTTSEVFKATIYKDGYGGSVSDFVSNENPVVIETSRDSDIGFRPIIATKATVNIIVGTDFDLAQFMTCGATDFYLLVEKGIRTDTYTAGTYVSSTYVWNEVVYKGFYVPVTDISIPDVPPLTLTLSFSDGMGFLKNSLYYEGTSNNFIGFRPSDRITLHELITACLAKTNLGFNFSLSFFFENADIGHTGSMRQLESIYVYKNGLVKDAGTYYTHYEILEFICNRFGLIVYQDSGQWFVMDYKEITKGSSAPRIVNYNAAGVYQSTGTITFEGVTVNSSTYKQIGQSQSNRLGLPKKYIEYNTNLKKFIKNAIRNDEFQAWFNSTTLYNWSTFGGGSISTKYTFANGRFGNAISGADTVTKYIKSDDIQVKAGDTIAVDWSQNQLYAGVNTKIAFILIGSDTITNYLQLDLDNSSVFFANPNYFSTSTVATSGLSKAIKIPKDGKLAAYIYQVEGAGNISYFEYLKIQIYGGSDSGADPAGTNNVIGIVERGTSDASFTSGAVLFDNTFYSYDPQVLPHNYIDATQNLVSNTTAFLGYMSKANLNPLNDNWYYDNSATYDYLYSYVVKNVAKNIMQNFVTIEGTFNYSGHPFNKWYTYTMISIGAKKYICLDYRWDIKQAEQEVSLFSMSLITTSPVINPIKYLNYNT